MPYDNLVDRAGAGALIPEQFIRDLVQMVPEASYTLRRGRRLQNGTRGQSRLPVLDALATAYFVAPADTGLKQTTDVSWRDVNIVYEEIAAIVPVPINVLNDADYDLWTEIRPRIAEAFGRLIDAAIIHGTNKPASWPVGMAVAAKAAGNAVDLSGATDLYDAIFAPGGVMEAVELDGFVPDASLAAVALRAQLRGLRESATGLPIFKQTVQAEAPYTLDGMPTDFVRNGSLVSTGDDSVLLLCGQWDQMVYSIRQDLSFTVHTDGVITDASKVIQHNLLQEDKVALRAVMRLGWAVPNPVTNLQPTAGDRYPFGILSPTIATPPLVVFDEKQPAAAPKQKG